MASAAADTVSKKKIGGIHEKHKYIVAKSVQAAADTASRLPGAAGAHIDFDLRCAGRIDRNANMIRLLPGTHTRTLACALSGCANGTRAHTRGNVGTYTSRAWVALVHVH